MTIVTEWSFGVWGHFDVASMELSLTWLILVLIVVLLNVSVYLLGC